MSERVDPLEFFLDLERRKENLGRTQDGRKYPGNTPPRTPELEVDSASDSWLNGLPSTEYVVNGTLQRFYTIGALAKALGNSPVTIRSWEAKGWLPAAKYRTPAPKGSQIPGKVSRGRRLYSEHQLTCIAKAYDKYILSPRKPNWDGFRRHLKTDYPTT